jgi:hypothetical protein
LPKVWVPQNNMYIKYWAMKNFGWKIQLNELGCSYLGHFSPKCFVLLNYWILDFYAPSWSIFPQKLAICCSACLAVYERCKAIDQTWPLDKIVVFVYIFLLSFCALKNRNWKMLSTLWRLWRLVVRYSATSLVLIDTNMYAFLSYNGTFQVVSYNHLHTYTHIYIDTYVMYICSY